MRTYTDIEQSKKLAEILSVDSADMFFVYDYLIGDFGGVDFIRPGMLETDDVPCWSLAALLDILPSEFKYYETTYEIDIRKYALTDDVDLYQIAYRNCKIDEDGHHSWKDMINTGEKEDFIDCCYEMILKLKEKDLL